VYFPDDVLLALSKPLRGVRFRQQGTISPPFVADILTAAYKNVNPEDIVEFVHSAIKDFSAVLVLDDDVSEKTGPCVSRTGMGRRLG
jgi:hypothetical protein